MISRHGVGLNPSILAVVVALTLLGILPTGCTSNRIDLTPTSTERPLEAQRRVEGPPAVQSAPPLVCPTIGVSSVPPAAPPGHRVMLSWKASAPADAKHAGAVGYCIYRGLRHKDPSPALLNVVPFPGTSCTDDLVRGDQKYYYVVRAISLKGVTSIVSNEVPAAIPTGNDNNPPSSGASLPLCREPTRGK